MLQMSDLLTHHTTSDSDDIGDEVIRTMFMVANKLEESMRLAYNSCEYTPYDSPAENSSLNGEAFYPESGELPELKYEHNEYLHPHVQYEDEFDLDSRTSYMDMKTIPCSQTTENIGSLGSRNSLFDCCECDRRFKSKSVLRRHVRVVHEGVTYPCEQCGKSFSRKWNLKQHINSVHERQIFQCDNCEKSFSSKNILLRHVRSSHEGVCYKCDQCDKTFSRKYDLNQHVIYCHYEISLESNSLNGVSLKEDTLQKPVEIPDQSALFKCKQSDNIFSRMSRLHEHRISHEYSRLTQIEYEESLFPQKYDLNKDKLFQHESKPFICQQCGRACSSKGILRRHIRVTHEGHNFPCDQCGKTFTRESNLREHRLAFHEGKFFKCDECDGAYSSRSILLRHVKYVHRGIHFRCDLCDKIFSRMYHLRIHQMSVHERVRFSCDQCDKSFAHKFDLKMHKATFHEGLYFHCNLCDRKFSRMSHLKTHQFAVHEVSTYSSQIRLLPQSDKVCLSHEENSVEYIYRKKFRCIQCQMCFKRNYQLKLHSKLFHGKRYRCHKCGRIYEFYGYLKKHLLFSHKNLCSLQLS
uniref:C2H2-type domain-containing protein n=1 Tax=Trichobilharzia regenti TaxID=157069 RepID=A0AA85IV09_TRIRE|nr:unnamed protein product [Trichobilharzia regenti]